MPAVITHDLFGREVYEDLYPMIGETKDEFDAFLLGCQGPDVLFFTHLNPAQASAWNIGSKMHRSDPVALLDAFLDATHKLPDGAYDIARSYFFGLLCHYILDSRMHPFIYAQQYRIADAGVEGLDRSHGHEIHAEIESELDVLVLSTKRETTIGAYEPERQILRASKPTAQTISYVYKNAAAQAPINRNISEDAYSAGLSAYRLALGALYSPTGVKRTLFGALERLFKDHSFLQAMSHRNQLLFESDFDNRDHGLWVDPWTDEPSTSSFWDIYNDALSECRRVISTMDITDRSATTALLESITDGRDFNGSPTRALLLGVEDL